MKNKAAPKVNNVSITCFIESGVRLIPIRPICQALEICPASQYKKIKANPDLSENFILARKAAKDGKMYEMLCLPVHLVFAWLFSINPAYVKEESRETVRKYRMECYYVLLDYLPLKKMKRK